ncbi:MAG: alcohol dehydrogenase catalytic domain-containing protein [Clostridiales Family XIII bacterium]|jgi:2-desacetyl-2-hydroxyethyl bacteriochlorophyllide A dehydrogenase|nr:alcohol dehydrogenase catalytic domain-containing protein [Clostridiales Family XIII bacterium]
MKGKMRAQVVLKPGKMELKEIDIPEITDDEVLVKIKYCGICGSDYSIFTGKYVPERLPLVTGHEMFGTIVELGENTKNLKIGDRVAIDITLPCGICYFCRRGDGLLCESFEQIGIHTKNMPGGFAEYVKAPWKNIYKIPDSVNDINAAFVEPVTTAIQASKKMNADMARSVVIIGVGLGIIHGLIAKLRGAAPIIIIGGNKERLKMAKKMCADFLINYHDTKDVVAEVKRLTNGVGADYVIEAVGSSKTYEQAFQMLRRGGKLESFGVTSANDRASLSPFDFVLNEKKVSGSCAGIGNDWGDAITLLEYGRFDLSPLVSMLVPLEELEVAMHEIQESKNIVKVLVSPEIKERKIF